MRSPGPTPQAGLCAVRVRASGLRGCVSCRGATDEATGAGTAECRVCVVHSSFHNTRGANTTTHCRTPVTVWTTSSQQHTAPPPPPPPTDTAAQRHSTNNIHGTRTVGRGSKTHAEPPPLRFGSPARKQTAGTPGQPECWVWWPPRPWYHRARAPPPHPHPHPHPHPPAPARHHVGCVHAPHVRQSVWWRGQQQQWQQQQQGVRVLLAQCQEAKCVWDARYPRWQRQDATRCPRGLVHARGECPPELNGHGECAQSGDDETARRPDEVAKEKTKKQKNKNTKGGKEQAATTRVSLSCETHRHDTTHMVALLSST